MMLAFQPEAEIARVLSRPLRRYTSVTIVAPGELRLVLVETRERGYRFSFWGIPRRLRDRRLPVA